MHAIVDRFATVRDGDPRRPLIHLPATNQTLTAADIDERQRRYQRVLMSLPIRSGELVVSASGNRAGTIPLLLACWSIGCPVLLVDVATAPAELAELVGRFRAAALVAGTRTADGANATSLDDELVVISREGQDRALYEGASLFKLTSGSTGVPKALFVTAAQLLADADHIVSAMGIAADDVQLVAIPLSHAYGFGNLVMPLLIQGTSVVLREAFAPQQVVADARRYSARAFHGVPFMFQHFLAHAPADGWPESVSLLVSAGAPLELETVRAFHERFGRKIHSFYGASEAGGIAYDDSDYLDAATVGCAMPGVTIELRPDASVPDGYGRVHVRSGAVAAGYVNDSEGGELGEHGFLTGDYGRVLADGRLVLAGRVSSFINVAGRKVQPGEVERVLREMKGVVDARVLGATDRARGEQIAAVVEAPPGLTVAQVRQHCASHLPSYKIPRVIIFVRELPRTSRGKTDHRALRALVEAEIERAT